MTHERGLAPSLQCLTSAIAALCHAATAPNGSGGSGARGGGGGGKRPATAVGSSSAPAATTDLAATVTATAMATDAAAATLTASSRASSIEAEAEAGAEAEAALPPQQLLSQAEGLLREAEGLAAGAGPYAGGTAALDAAPYTALMAAHNRRGSPHRALRLYRRLRRRGVEPSPGALTQVLLACRRTMDAGGVYQALRLLRSKGWHLRPERGLYQAALTACYCEGDEEMGRGLREEALRLYGMEVGGEEEVLERALKWGVTLPNRGDGGGAAAAAAAAAATASASASLRVGRQRRK